MEHNSSDSSDVDSVINWAVYEESKLPDPIRDTGQSRPALLFRHQCAVFESRLKRHFFLDELAGSIRPRLEHIDTLQRLYGVNLKLTIADNVEQIVKARWIQDGLWNPMWNKTNRFDRWAHEEDAEIKSNLDIDHNLSRPPYVFDREVAAELVWLKHAGQREDWYKPWLEPEAAVEEMRNRTHLDRWAPDDLNEVARTNIRMRWVLDDIWDPNWVDSPGDRWRHEVHDPASYRVLEMGCSGCPFLEPPEIPDYPAPPSPGTPMDHV